MHRIKLGRFYGVDAETITFIPGDTSTHTIHLYGYFANNINGALQFTASLPVTPGAPQQFYRLQLP